MNSKYIVTLDVQKSGYQSILDGFRSGDTARSLNISLNSNDMPMEIKGTAILKCVLPDDFQYINTAEYSEYAKKTYSIGDKVYTYNTVYKYYTCKTAITTAEDFNESKWNIVNLPAKNQEYTCTIKDNIISCDIPNSVLFYPGEIKCELTLTDTKVITSPRFKMLCTASMFDTGVSADNKKNAFEQALADIDGLESDLATETSLRTSADNALGARIDAEATARAAKDTELEEAITEEVDKIDERIDELDDTVTNLTGENIKYQKRGVYSIKYKIDQNTSAVSELKSRVSATEEFGGRITSLETDNVDNKAKINQALNGVNQLNNDKAGIGYVDTHDAATLQSANANSNANLQTAKDYADTKDTAAISTATATAKAYTDTAIETYDDEITSYINTEDNKKQDKIENGYDTKTFGWIKGYVDPDTKSLVSNDNFSTTNYMVAPVPYNATAATMSYYLYDSNDKTRIHFYSALPAVEEVSQFIHISSVKLTRGTNKVDIPANAKYVRFSVANSSINSFRVMPYEMGSGSGESDVYWCAYGTTPFDEITSAIENSKLPCCQISGKIFVYQFKESDDSYWFACTSGSQTFRFSVTNPKTYSNITMWYSESSTRKVNKIVGYETSTVFYPTTKAVVDYVADQLGAVENGDY